MGVEVEVEGLTKSFGSQNIWSDVTLTLPPGEISVLLGPSGTGKSVFLKSLVGLLKPEQGSIVINDVDLVRAGEHDLYEIRKLFGVLFQDGALFGSMNLFDNIAFPLREHTRKSETDIKNIVLEKMDKLAVLTGDLREQYETDLEQGGIIETYEQVSATTRYEVLDVGLKQVNDAQDTATLVVFGQYVVESVNSGDQEAPEGSECQVTPEGAQSCTQTVELRMLEVDGEWKISDLTLRTTS